MATASNPLVGLVGWRGMVGSVLMDRMQAENDFALVVPVFFSTSSVGGAAPAMAKNETRLLDAMDVRALARCDIVISCQGGDLGRQASEADGRLTRNPQGCPCVAKPRYPRLIRSPSPCR